MTTIELTPQERRNGMKVMLLYPLILVALLFACLFFLGPLFRYILGLMVFTLYIFFRNVFLLWREHGLNEVFRVDLHHLEKRFPDGSTQKAAWCDLQSVTCINKFPLGWCNYLLSILLGPKPIQLFFSDGTVISMLKLLKISDEALFWKIFQGIAMAGPLGNPFLVELHACTQHDLVGKEIVEKNAYFRACVINQFFPLGLLFCAYVFYFWMGRPWPEFVAYNCTVAIISPCLLAGVHIFYRITGRPGLF